MRKLLTLMITTLMLVAFGIATAEAVDTINVTVTITKTLSVSLSPTAWAIVGPVAESSVSTTADGAPAGFTATNDGNSSESLTTTVGASSPSLWAAGATPGPDVFVMEQSTDGGSIWVNLSGGASLATGLAKGGTQGFDLRFTAPESTDDGGTPQTITVTVTAS